MFGFTRDMNKCVWPNPHGHPPYADFVSLLTITVNMLTQKKYTAEFYMHLLTLPPEVAYISIGPFNPLNNRPLLLFSARGSADKTE